MGPGGGSAREESRRKWAECLEDEMMDCATEPVELQPSGGNEIP